MERACAQARRAHVPFVVVITMVFPSTASRVNSRGEFPRSKLIAPLTSASMRRPSRSPARRMPAFCRRQASASAISSTGTIAVAPLARAVAMLLVARKTSITTQSVSAKSRCFNAANSAGVKSTSICFTATPEYSSSPGRVASSASRPEGTSGSDATGSQRRNSAAAILLRCRPWPGRVADTS